MACLRLLSNDVQEVLSLSCLAASSLFVSGHPLKGVDAPSWSAELSLPPPAVRAVFPGIVIGFDRQKLRAGDKVHRATCTMASSGQTMGQLARVVEKCARAMEIRTAAFVTLVR